MKLEFLKRIIQSDTNESSKRFNGTIGYLLGICTIYIIALIDLLKDGILSEISKSLLETSLWSAVILLGAASVEKIWTPK